MQDVNVKNVYLRHAGATVQAQDDNTIIDKYISLGLSGSDTNTFFVFFQESNPFRILIRIKPFRK